MTEFMKLDLSEGKEYFDYTQHNGNLAIIDENFQNLSKSLIAMEETLKELEQNGTNQEEIVKLQTDLSNLSTALSQLETDITTAQSTATSAQSTANSAQSTANSAQSTITSLQAELTALANQVAEMEDTLGDGNSGGTVDSAEMVAVKLQITELQEELSALENAVDGNFSSLTTQWTTQVQALEAEIQVLETEIAKIENYTLTAQDKTDISAQVALTEADKTEIAALAKGEPGVTPNIEIGNVETLAYTEEAYAKIRDGSTAEEITVDIGVPQGAPADAPVEKISVSYVNATSSLGIYKYPSGICVFTGQAVCTSAWASGSTIATLPEGFRPVNTVGVFAGDSSTVGRVRLYSSGVVEYTGSALPVNSYIVFSGAYVEAGSV